MAMPCVANVAIVSSCRPVACSMQSMPAATRSRSESSPKQCAVTRAPSSCAAAMASARPRGPAGDRSPVSRSIQSPTSLTQPSPRLASCADVRDELVRLDLVGVVADVAAGAGDVPAGADDRGRSSRSSTHRVSPGARVPDEQGAGLPVGDRLLLGSSRVDRPVGVEADVAVRVHEPGSTHPRRSDVRAAAAVKDTLPPTTHTRPRRPRARRVPDP